jgi:FKBP-type peptidyl-prolyl cis-trans isomerase
VVDTQPGKGRRAASGNRLTVRYKGLTTDAQGKWYEFDSNKGKALHFEVGAGDVIRGWDLGLLGMRCGGTRRLIVPPALGYGDAGAPGKIPPRATLVFEVTLENVV